MADRVSTPNSRLVCPFIATTFEMTTPCECSIAIVFHIALGLSSAKHHWFVGDVRYYCGVNTCCALRTSSDQVSTAGQTHN